MPSQLCRRHLLSVLGLSAAGAVVPRTWASPAPIAEEHYVRIGGVEQWVAIRGRDRSRLPILFLHGGPCEAESPFLSVFAPWEERYVVAQWDQRGTGQSFAKSGTPPKMTMEQITKDAIEVTQYVLKRLNSKKLIVVGFSWGAEVGLNVARARPELLYALVGTGQPISGPRIFEDMRSSAVERAEAAGDQQAAAELKRFTVADFADMAKLHTYFRYSATFPNPGPDWDYIGKMFAMLGSPAKPSSPAAAAFFAANPSPADPASHPRLPAETDAGRLHIRRPRRRPQSEGALLCHSRSQRSQVFARGRPPIRKRRACAGEELHPHRRRPLCMPLQSHRLPQRARRRDPSARPQITTESRQSRMAPACGLRRAQHPPA